MVYILRGNRTSPCTQRVLLALAEANRLDQTKLIDIPYTGLRDPEYLAFQPFGQLPHLQDTDVGAELYESRAIAKYIALKEKLAVIPCPSEVLEFGKFEQACSIEACNFDRYTNKLGWELIFKLAAGLETDPGEVEYNKKALADTLAVYEILLSKTAYLAGDNLTLADLFHLPFGTLVESIGAAPALSDGSLPHVAKWWKALNERESWAKVNEFVKT